MKKGMAFILALVIVTVMAAGCAGGTEENPVKAPLTDDLETIIDNIYAQQSVPFEVVTVPVDITDTEFALKAYTGLDSAELIREAAASEAMIGAIAYSMVLVRVKDAKDAKTVAEQMKAGIDTRKWICVEADDLKVAGYGDVVMLIMISSEQDVPAQSMVDAFRTVCGAELDFTL